MINILFRFEGCWEGHSQEGIYQVLDYNILNDFAREVMSLPVPQKDIESDETFVFWFTEEGLKKYGQYFFNLIDPVALNYLDCFHMFLYMMEETEAIRIYEDKFQVACPYETCQTALEKGIEVSLWNLDKVLKEVSKYVEET